MNEDKEQLFWRIWNEQEIASSYIAEYDSIPHLYGEYVMYQAEGQIIDLIAQNHNITCSELAEITKKTPSACSQIVRKLKDRGFVIQTRNEKNNRKYNLSLSNVGKKIYEERKHFTKNCQLIMMKMLDRFTEEELIHHIKVQQVINEAYAGDVIRNKEQLK